MAQRFTLLMAVGVVAAFAVIIGFVGIQLDISATHAASFVQLDWGWLALFGSAILIFAGGYIGRQTVPRRIRLTHPKGRQVTDLASVRERIDAADRRAAEQNALIDAHFHSDKMDTQQHDKD
jgi:hypothetical protein